MDFDTVTENREMGSPIIKDRSKKPTLNPEAIWERMFQRKG